MASEDVSYKMADDLKKLRQSVGTMAATITDLQARVAVLETKISELRTGPR